MRTRKIFLTVSIIAVIVAIVLISLKAYYVAIALVVGALLIGHRELWSLLGRKKLPPIDERVKENTSKSIRNGFIFLVIVIAFLMLPFSVKLIETPDTVHVLGGLFVSAGIVYLFSYLFYDRAEPRMAEKKLRLLRTFLLVTGISVGAFIVSVFLHNALSGLLGVEEPVFFIISVFICPVAFAVGVIGVLVIFFRGLFTKAL